MLTAVFHGLLVSLSLIAAIGSQNAFVLRQGLRREHVGLVVATCALSDAVLITLGISGMGTLIAGIPWLATGMKWLGAAFLFVYGALRFRAAYQGGESLIPADKPSVPARDVLLVCLTLTWANPHVYLDTVLLLGTIGTQYAPYQALFGVGAALGSLVFFVALGYGARLLAPLFEKPRAWVVLELIIGCTMWAIAWSLLAA
ncbi:amino acid transporter [Donghicola sp. C2-DW-16]|uniref:Amino acid transporter n=1 Tax=Donghicola mangrovi TaxID=2729614 RepID=A0ABX2PBA2_9RHOB|nr:LysE/ArgO family amino acid transporter [Donghicola mangrovi]NVO26658.1 amino acid transporter [Donghicola mangrovi]